MTMTIKAKFQEIKHPAYQEALRFAITDTNIYLLLFKYKGYNTWCCYCGYNKVSLRKKLGTTCRLTAQELGMAQLKLFVTELRQEAAIATIFLSSHIIIK